MSWCHHGDEKHKQGLTKHMKAVQNRSVIADIHAGNHALKWLVLIFTFKHSHQVRSSLDKVARSGSKSRVTGLGLGASRLSSLE
jgi:hypothetical protein